MGPSGCGKTTALRCAIGRLDVDVGTVSILGNKPHTVNHGVPGCRVGYMPQVIYLNVVNGEVLFSSLLALLTCNAQSFTCDVVLTCLGILILGIGSVP